MCAVIHALLEEESANVKRVAVADKDWSGGGGCGGKVLRREDECNVERVWMFVFCRRVSCLHKEYKKLKQVE